MTTRNYYYKGWHVEFGFKADNKDLIMTMGLPGIYPDKNPMAHWELMEDLYPREESDDL